MSNIGKPFSKKLIHQLLIGLIIVAIFGFVAIMATSNPADLKKQKEEKARLEEIQRQEKGDETEARRRLADEAQKIENEKKRLAGEAERIKALEAKVALSETGGMAVPPPPMPPGVTVTPAQPGKNSGPNTLSANDPETERIIAQTSANASGSAQASPPYEKYGDSNGLSSIPDTATNGEWRKDAKNDPRYKESGSKNASLTTGSGKSNQAATDPSGLEYYDAIKPKVAPGKHLLAEGAFIPCTLITGVNSQMPGNVQCRVTKDVYDTTLAEKVLIPRGTKLVGKYASKVMFGQERLGMSFRRIIFQDGRAVDLPEISAMDIDGKTGVSGEYFSNMWRAVGPTALVAIIGRAIEPNPTPTSAFTTQSPNVVQQVWPKITERILQRTEGALPYIEIFPGQELVISTVTDIVIP